MPVVATANVLWVAAVASLRGTAYWTLHHFTVATHVRLFANTSMRVLWTGTVDARLHAMLNFRAGSKVGIKSRNVFLVRPTEVACA